MVLPSGIEPPYLFLAKVEVEGSNPFARSRKWGSVPDTGEKTLRYRQTVTKSRFATVGITTKHPFAHHGCASSRQNHC